MADEPRRSVRATKGQHTKSLDLLDQPAEPKKKGSKKGSKKAAAEEEVEIIRCVCGATEQQENDTEAWIACDSCEAWQHNVCVGLSSYEEDTPDKYLCEQCGPEFHTELLESIQRGEKLWEERRRAWEKEMAEEGKGKKGKKGKGKRTSDPKEIINKDPAKTKSPSVPAEDVKKDKKDTVARAGSTKRKTRDESQDKDSSKGPQSKVRKVSAAHTTPQQKSPPSDLPVKIIDLEHSRQGGAKLVHKGLLYAIPISVQNRVYQYAMGDTLETKAERLAIQVEDAIWNTHPDKAAYNKQARALFSNLKINQELCNGLLTKSLAPRTLAVMTSDEMASKEKRREEAEMKARSDKQSIMVTEDGPRMRRTHKGDEVIEEDNFAVPSDNTMSTARRRSMLDPNSDMATRSRENSPGNEVELPENIDDYRSRDNIRGQVAPKQPLNVETKPIQPPMRKASTQGDFDIKKVFSSVQSPTGAQHHIRRPSSNIAPPANGPGVDPEIDKLLQDDEGNESPPYSPAEYNSDPDIVWRGMVDMDSVATFPAVAKHIGGADLSRQVPWNDILQKDLRVAGRIDPEKANEYLCSLRYSQPTDVVVVAVTPTGETAAQKFQELYQYFHSKNRYGVLSNKGIGNIRDTYLVPVPPNPSNLPDFIINLEGHKVPENRTEPMILVALVIRNEYHPEANRSFDGTVEAQSPSVTGHPQRQMSISGAGPAMSPIAPQGSFQSGPPSQPMMTPEEAQRRAQQEETHLRDQRTGEETAARILGHHVHAPTVTFLMPQAYQMRPLEWEVIRDILEEDQKAQTDLQHLSQVLEARMAAKTNKPAQL